MLRLLTHALVLAALVLPGCRDPAVPPGSPSSTTGSGDAVAAGVACPSVSKESQEPGPWIAALADHYERQDVRYRVLPNGVQLVVLRRGSVPWCALATVLPGGARQDPPGLSGLAHLAEHLMFEGAPGEKDPDAESDALGIHANAYTLADYTVVVEELSPSVLEPALQLHVSRLMGTEFQAAQLAREKRVVEDERRFRVDEPPLGHAEEQLLKRMWQGHPFGRPVLGWPEDLAAIQVDSLKAWMARHLQPRGAVMALVGQVDPDRALQRMEQAVARWQPTGPTPAAAPVPVVTTLSGLNRSSRSQPPALGTVPVRSHTEAVLWATAASALGKPSESADRLLAVLLDRDVNFGLPTFPDALGDIDIQADYRAELHVGTLVMTAVPRGETTLAQVHRATLALLDQLVGTGPTPHAVSVAKLRLAADHSRALALHASLAERLAVDQALLGRWKAQADRLRALATVTPEQVRIRAAALRSAPLQAAVAATEVP